MKQTELFYRKPPDHGRQLRDAGMERVERNSETWGDDVRAAIEYWFRKMAPLTEFTAEDMRAYLTEERGITEPHHPNAWSAVLGGVARRWIKEHKVVKGRYIQAKNPQAHARAIRSMVKV